MRLQRLTGLERQKIIDEAREVEAAIARYRQILADEAQVRALIAEELTELKERYGDGRRTEIVPEAQEFTAEDLIADEEMVVTISHRSYIKRTPLTIYRSQRRGGKGRTGMATRENDFVSQLYIASTHSYLPGLHQQGPGLLAAGCTRFPSAPPRPRARPSSTWCNWARTKRSPPSCRSRSSCPGSPW